MAVPDPALVAEVGAGQGLVLGGVPLLDSPAGHARLGPLLGRPIDRALMAALRQAIQSHHAEAGRPFVDVGFPPQDVTDGVLQVVVTEFRLGEVAVAGNRWFADATVRLRAGLEPGLPVDKAALDRRLLQLAAHPHLAITPEFRPGAAPGTTDATLRVQDRFPLRVAAGFDRSGSPVTGWERWTLGATWTDALWRGHTLAYQFLGSTDVFRGGAREHGRALEPAMQGHAGSWQIPLPSGHTLAFSGGYVRQVPRLGPDLGSVGETMMAGASHVVPLVAPGFLGAAARQEAAFGYDFKRTNNNLSFGGATVSRGFSEVSQFSWRHGLVVPDGWGQTVIANTLVGSPGGMTPLNTNRAFQPAPGQSGTPGARASYVYNRLSVTRLAPLSQGFGLVLRASGQAASTTLLPSEQLSIAGIDAVRGYQEFGAAGSQGVVLSGEVQGPAFSPGERLGAPGLRDRAQPHVFADFGRGWNPVASSSAPASLRTASAGLGARYEVAQNLALRLEQGWQLIRQPRQGANGAFLHVSVTASW